MPIRIVGPDYANVGQTSVKKGVSSMNPLARAEAINFLNAHGGLGKVQRIDLPHGDFMLRQADKVWSSLTPFDNPTIVNVGDGRDFYDHRNFIISTSGLAPADHPGGRPDWGDPDVGISSHNHFLAALNNHYDMRLGSYEGLRGEFLEQVAGYEFPMDWDLADRLGDEYTPSWDDLFTEYRGWSSGGIPETQLMTPELFQGFVRLLNEQGAGGSPRVIVDHPSFNLFHLDGTPVNSQPGLIRAQNPSPEQVSQIARVQAVLKHQGFEQVGIPNGSHWGQQMRESGVFQWEDARGYMNATAYRDGKQIVDHPAHMMPERVKYRYLQGLPFNVDEHRLGMVDNPSLPLDENLETPAGIEMPTLIRTHVFPSLAEGEAEVIAPERLPEGR